MCVCLHTQYKEEHPNPSARAQHEEVRQRIALREERLARQLALQEPSQEDTAGRAAGDMPLFDDRPTPLVSSQLAQHLKAHQVRSRMPTHCLVGFDFCGPGTALIAAAPGAQPAVNLPSYQVPEGTPVAGIHKDGGGLYS